MIGQQALMDAHFTLLHLTIGMIVESLLIAFATVAFVKFVLFSIFETRYLVAIWKAGSRSLINAEGYEAPRHEMWRELSLLHSCLYGTLLMAGIISMYELHNHMKLILLLMYTFWIPQIIRNVFHDSRKPLDPHYIFGITVTRLAIPLYIFGFPNNFMHIEPDKNWCVCLTLFLGLQAVFLLLQHYLGPRWFIPRQMLPEKYNYHRKFDHTKRHATECVICMTDIDLFRRTSDCMVTPCDHFFHSGCLQIWMDIKMECPTCRRALPSA
ncbi:transmembrane E3 ubiquitin-protein ligase 1-like [Trifolium pratense]|uniref:RING-type E3 ubiquitin transferase n=1 Tax=Trifolium pratense TaxID=57577 RepID=A0A2K3LEN2_TRIPR|nr:transmembrane E3 ubiquitin-protein ligase 1-like [Trifolium pratense]